MLAPVRLAADLVTAERVVASRRMWAAAGPLLAAAQGADVIAGVTVLLPWGKAAGDGTAVRAPTSFVVAVLIGITLRQVVLFALRGRVQRRVDVFIAALDLAVVAVVARSALRFVTYPRWHAAWPIVATFITAFVAAAVLSSRAAGRIHSARSVDLLAGLPPMDEAGIRGHLAGQVAAAHASPTPRPSVATAGLASLGLAVVGLAGPWQRLHGPAVDAAAGGGDYAWLGYEVPATLVLRWIVLLTGASICLCAITPRLRRLQPFVLLAGGTATAASVLGPGAAVTVVAGNSILVPGRGASLALAGALGTVGLGLAGLLLGRPRTRTAAVALLTCAVAVVFPLLASSRVATAGSRLPVLGDPVFVPAADPERMRLGAHEPGDAYAGNRIPDLTTTAEGAVWFASRIDDRRTVIQRLIHGWAMPVTVLTSRYPTSVDLVGVNGQAALVNAESYAPVAGTDHTYSYVVRIDLRRASVVLAPFSAAAGVTQLARAQRGFLDTHGSAPGFEDTRVHAEQAADGSIVLDRTSMNQPLHRYPIDPVTAWHKRVWTLRRVITMNSTSLRTLTLGPRAVTYAISERAPAAGVLRIRPDGTETVVAGEVSDARCGIVRDPLSTFLGGVGESLVDSVVADRAGDVWLTLRATQVGLPRLLVLTPDAVLRTPAALEDQDVTAIAATPDGSLFVSTSGRADTLGSTYRIRDAAALARSASPLPTPAKACISENRTRVTARGTVSSVGTIVHLPNRSTDAAAVVDERGTVLVAGTSDRTTVLMAERPRHQTRLLATVDGDVRGLLADGHGGAWWFPTRTFGGPERRPGSDIHHVDAAGRVRLVVPVASTLTRMAVVVATVDPQDGSLVWSDRGAAGWHRTTVAGTTTPFSYEGDSAPLVAGTIRYAADPTGPLHRVGTNGLGPRVLGVVGPSGLSVLASTAAGSPLLTRIGSSYPGGDSPSLAMTTDGRLLISDGSLARFDGTRLTLLARATEGGTTSPVSPLTVLGDHVYYLTATGTVVSVSAG